MKNYSIGEFAKKIGVSVNTLQRWDRDGILIANRTPTNRRYYTDEQLDHYGKNNGSNLEEKISIILFSDKSSDEKLLEIQKLINHHK